MLSTAIRPPRPTSIPVRTTLVYGTMAMATAPDDKPSCEILIEGYMKTERPSHWPRKHNSKRAWCVLEQDQALAFSTYKDKTKSKLKETIRFLEVNKLEVDKHQDDTYLCIKYGKQILHLRAETKQDRDEWYETIMRSLCRQQGAASGDQPVPGYESDSMRVRIGSESTANRPPATTRGRRPSPGIVQSSPGAYNIFQDELKRVVSPSARPAVQEERNNGSPDDDCAHDYHDDDVSKVHSKCCIRKHEMIQEDKALNVYTNVHYVPSEEQLQSETNCRLRSLEHTKDAYDNFHNVKELQSEEDSEEDTEKGIYEVHMIPHGAMATTIQNNLSPDSVKDDHFKDDNFNIVEEQSTPSPGPSIEDNSEVKLRSDPPKERKASRPTPPLVPPCTDDVLKTKIRQLKEEQKQFSITKTFDKSSLLGDKDKITLMEENDGLWVAGLDQREAQLRDALKVGDQLIKINSQRLTSAAFAMDTMRTTDDHQVQFVLKRIPHGCVCTIKRPSSRDDLGIQLEGNEIISVDPHGLASKRGDLRPETTGVTGRMCNWAITEINAKAVDLFASSDDVMKLLRHAKKDVMLVLQPVDLIQSMREALKGTHYS